MAVISLYCTFVRKDFCPRIVIQLLFPYIVVHPLVYHNRREEEMYAVVRTIQSLLNGSDYSTDGDSSLIIIVLSAVWAM